MTADFAIIQLLLSILLIGVTLIWGIFRYRRSGYWRRGVHNKLQAYLLWTLSALITLSCFIPWRTSIQNTSGSKTSDTPMYFGDSRRSGGASSVSVSLSPPDL